MNKVYCGDCDNYCGPNEFAGPFCNILVSKIKHYTEDWHHPAKSVEIKEYNSYSPRKKNKNNDCPDFIRRRKRINFWTGVEY